MTPLPDQDRVKNLYKLPTLNLGRSLIQTYANDYSVHQVSVILNQSYKIDNDQGWRKTYDKQLY